MTCGFGALLKFNADEQPLGFRQLAQRALSNL
jgi:hypothetical protein